MFSILNLHKIIDNMNKVCLILEGTYPYNTGGVSSWTHSLITSLPEIQFSIAHVYSGKEPITAKYEIPSNVLSINTVA